MYKTQTVTITYTNFKWVDPDKAVAQPNKHRVNDNRKTVTRRHNKTVLYRRG